MPGMLGHDVSTAVPLEILRQFFWGWTFAELQPLLRVDSRWRAVAMNHPVYWKTIDLTRNSIAALNLFLLRIERTLSRPFSVYILIGDSWDPIVTRVVPALIRHLALVEMLDLYVHNDHGEAILAALCRPAPLLRKFNVAFLYTYHKTAPTLPTNVFAGAAPVLESVGLEYVTLPKPVPACISQVRRLVFGTASSSSTEPFDIPDVFAHFPRLREVKFTDGSMLSDRAYAEPSSWTDVESVTFRLTDTCLDYALRHLPLSLVPHIQTARANSAQCGILVGHLHGDLDFAVLPGPDPREEPYRLFFVHLRERGGRVRRRTFVESWFGWVAGLSPKPNDLFARADVAARIVSLTLSTVYWTETAAFLMPLPNVAELHIILEPEAPHGLPSEGAVRAPNLRCVTLRSEADTRCLEKTDVRQFCLRALPETRLPVEVRLDNVLTEPYGEVVFPDPGLLIMDNDEIP